MTNSRARGRARVVRRASREGARRNVRPDAPNKNCEQKTNNKICIIAMLCTVCSTLITVKSTLDDSINVNIAIFQNFFVRHYQNMRGAH